MNPADLERLIDRELKRLPAPRAPRTLLPRVLAATVERARVPWYARPFLTWPRAWQAAALAVLVALGVAVAMFVPSLRLSPFDAPQWAEVQTPGRVASITTVMSEAVTLARVFWQVFIEPIAFYLLVLAVSLSLACAAIWTALERFTLEGASQQ